MTIRPLEPSDRDVLAEAFRRLSPESRYRRFLGAVDELSERQLDYLTNVDQHDHVALVAIDDDTGEGVGVARFVRIGPGVAEPAVAVADDWQGRGVGAALLDALAGRAHDEGVSRFVAPVLAVNRPAIGALARLGDTTLERHGHEVELTIELPATPARESGLRAALRAVAAGTLDPALAFWQRRMPRRDVAREEQRDAVVAAAETAAAPVAAELAAALGASLTLVAARGALRGDGGELEARVEREASRLRARVRDVRAVVRAGDLGAVLLDAAIAERARLIVVAGEPEGKGAAGYLGSVWDHVAHHAPCDVLIARAGRGG